MLIPQIAIVCAGVGYLPDLGDPVPALKFLGAFPERVARAALIEPTPSRMDHLRRLIGEDLRFSFVGTAVASESGPITLWQVEEYADQELIDRGFGTTVGRSGSHGWTSGDRDHVVGLLAQRLGVDRVVASQHVAPCTVEGRRLDDILADLGIESVDYLQVDVEGFDDEVLLTLDLDRIRPSLVRCEFVRLPARRRDRLSAVLATRGYKAGYRVGGMDSLFVLDGPVPMSR